MSVVVSDEAMTQGHLPRSAEAFLRRDLLLLTRNRASLISMFVVPGLFMMCLHAVFGHAAEGIGLDYALFLFAGSLIQAAMFTAASSAMTVAVDIDAGLVMRFKTQPRSTVGFIVGRLVVDAIRMVGSCVTLVVVGMLCGMDIGPVSILKACAIGVVISLSFSCFANGIVLNTKKPIQAASLIQTVEMLVLLFSTTFIPGNALSGTLKTIVVHMPFSPIAEYIRYLTGSPLSHSTRSEAFAWLIGLAAIGVGLAWNGFRGKNS